MTSICVQDRGGNTDEWLKTLPDCPAVHPTPTPYNLAPILVGWGIFALVVLCITTGLVYLIHTDYRAKVNKEMVRGNVPDLIKKVDGIGRQVDALVRLKLDDRVHKVEQYVGGT